MTSQQHQEPPSYNEEPASASAHIHVEPPTYDDVAESQPRDLLTTDELPCLVMDDCFIYAESQPTNSLYEMSNAPTAGRSGPIAVEKFVYRLSTNDGEGALRQRKRHLYDFREDISPDEFGGVVSLQPKTSSKFAFKNIQLHRGFSWTSGKADGHFRVGQSMKQKMSKKDELEWKDWEGRLVAVETKLTRMAEGKVDRPPRLEVRVANDMKELDLLVTLWAARVWRESLKELAEPFSWSKCECRRKSMRQQLLTSASQTNLADEPGPCWWEVVIWVRIALSVKLRWGRESSDSIKRMLNFSLQSLYHIQNTYSVYTQ